VLRRHWPIILGTVNCLTSFWSAVRWVLDRVGYAELLVAHFRDPGWLGAMLTPFLDPPPWLVFPCFVIGFLLIWWDMRRHRGTPQPLNPSFRAAPPARTTSLAATVDPQRKTEETPEEQKRRSEEMFPPRLYPRMDTEKAGRISDVDSLLAYIEPSRRIVPHILATLTDETHGYITELLALVQDEIDHQDRARTAGDAAPPPLARNRLRELLVLLKGNDISIYALHHMKILPERWEAPPERDPFQAELQLILAFWPGGAADSEEIEVQVDHGQPRWVKAGLPF